MFVFQLEQERTAQHLKDMDLQLDKAKRNMQCEVQETLAERRLLNKQLWVHFLKLYSKHPDVKIYKYNSSATIPISNQCIWLSHRYNTECMLTNPVLSFPIAANQVVSFLLVANLLLSSLHVASHIPSSQSAAAFSCICSQPTKTVLYYSLLLLFLIIP